MSIHEEKFPRDPVKDFRAKVLFYVIVKYSFPYITLVSSNVCTPNVDFSVINP